MLAGMVATIHRGPQDTERAVSLRVACFVLSVIAAGLAVEVARRDRTMRPVAAVMSTNVVVDLVRTVLATYIFAPYRITHGPVSFVGAARVAFHVEQALLLSRVALLSWLVWSCLSTVRAWPPFAGAWLTATTLLASWYPEVRGEALGRVYRALTVAAVIVGASALLRVARGRGRAPLVSLVLLGGLGAELAGPYLGSPFDWWTAQLTWLVLFAGLSCLFAGWICSRPSLTVPSS